MVPCQKIITVYGLNSQLPIHDPDQRQHYEIRAILFIAVFKNSLVYVNTMIDRSKTPYIFAISLVNSLSLLLVLKFVCQLNVMRYKSITFKFSKSQGIQQMLAPLVKHNASAACFFSLTLYYKYFKMLLSLMMCLKYFCTNRVI